MPETHIYSVIIQPLFGFVLSEELQKKISRLFYDMVKSETPVRCSSTLIVFNGRFVNTLTDPSEHTFFTCLAKYCEDVACSGKVYWGHSDEIIGVMLLGQKEALGYTLRDSLKTYEAGGGKEETNSHECRSLLEDLTKIYNEWILKNMKRMETLASRLRS